MDSETKWRRSRELLERAKNSLVGGVSSPFRAKFPVPLFFEDGEGSRLRDVDGNEYIDYTLAWGPLILGHKHPRIVEAAAAQARRPHTYGAQHELEYQTAELIQRAVPCAGRVALTSSGSEALQLAFRLARAFTGRNLILKFEGHYHGWMDSALLSYKPSREQMGSASAPNAVPGSRGQVPNSAENVIVARWNSIEAAEQAFERRPGEIAAAVMEPVLCNSGCLLPRDGYLEAVQGICRRHGALLIFDEVITGLRMAPGGAQEVYGVTPGIATLGKAIGGGLPLSAIAGRAEIMELIVHGGVGFGGTFNGNPLSLGGAKACLEALCENDGAALLHANRIGRMLMEGLRELGGRHGIPLRVTGFGAAFSVHFTQRAELWDYRDTLDDDAGMLQRFLRLALEEGVYVLADGRFYVSAAHTEQDAAETLAALERVFPKLAAAG